MRRRLSILTLICCSLLCTVVGVSDVWAIDANINGGYDNLIKDSNQCTGPNCGAPKVSHKPIAFGYRVSLVDKYGKQIDKTDSVDYWSDWGSEQNNSPYSYNVYYGYSFLAANGNEAWKRASAGGIYSKIHYYQNQMPKTSSLASRGNLITTADPYKGNYYKDTLVDNYKTDIKKVFGNCGNIDKNVIIYTRADGSPTGGSQGDSCYHNNYAKFAYVAMKSAIDKEDFSVFIDMIKKTGFEKNNKNDQDIIVKAREYTLMIEPLSAIYRNAENYTFVGTSYDLALMNFFSSYNYGWSYSRFSYLNPIVFASGKGTRAGITLTTEGNNSTDKLSISSSNSGVFLINISEISKNPCNLQVQSAYTQFKKDNDKAKYNSSVKTACESEGISNCSYLYADNYDKYGIEPSTIASCKAPTCESTYHNYITKNKTAKNFIDNLLNDIDNTLFKNDVNVTSASKNVKKGTHIWGAQAAINFGTLNGISSGTTLNACRAYDCATLLKTYGTDSAKILDKLFNTNNIKYPLLKEENYDELGIDPSCDALPPDCYAKQEGSCSSSAPLVFSDYNASRTSFDAHEKCIRKGIAYYDDNQGNLQTSKNTRYTTIAGPDIFCSETVTFDLPKESDMITKAGRVFQWGTNIQTTTNNGNDDDVKTFGTMTIEQTCYTKEVSKKISIGTKFDWKKENKINTKISIKYTDPTNKYEIDENKSLEPILNEGSIQYDKNYMNSQGEIKKATDRFTISATYRFDYNLEFKWYSDKSDKYEAKNNLSLNDVNKNFNYVFIGYGLPTSLATSDGTYKENLDVLIKDIGTDGRFDKFVKNINKNNSNENENDSFEYSCSFKIHNETFGNECCTKEGEIIPNAPSYCGKCEGDGEPEGLDVVFRTIDLMDSNSEEELDRAFPGMSGTGVTNGTRKMGANWDKVYSADNGAQNIFNILSNSIYSKKEPMYHINLNVSLIKKIREANNSLRRDGGDPYTDMTYESGALVGGTGLKASENNGYRGYIFDEITNSAESAFLNWLVREGALDTNCMDGKRHVIGCQQEWWNEE